MTSSTQGCVLLTIGKGKNRRQIRDGDRVRLRDLGLTPDGCPAFDVRHGTQMTVVDGLKGVKGADTVVIIRQA